MLLIKRNLLVLISFILMILLLMPSTLVSANGETYEQTTLSATNAKVDDLSDVTIKSNEGEIPVVNMPNTSINKATNFVDKKGADVISFLQAIGQPFMIGVFILGMFMTMMGAFSKSSGVFKGIVVMLLAVLLYTGLNVAPDLLDFGQNWLRE